MIARYQHLDVARQIKSQTFLLSGAEDELMPAKFAHRLHQNIENSEYVEVEGGPGNILSKLIAEIKTEEIRVTQTVS